MTTQLRRISGGHLELAAADGDVLLLLGTYPTYTDRFDRVNGPVGNSPIGTPYEGSGSWTIAGYQLVPPGGSLDILVFDSGSADVSISIDIIDNPVLPESAGLTLRWSDNNNWQRVVCDSVSTYVQKNVGGSISNLAVYPTGNPAGKTLRVVIFGNSYTTYLDGVLLGSVSESHNATATRHGLHANASSAKLDNLAVSFAATVEQTATDSATVTDLATAVSAVELTVTDGASVGDRAVLNDNDQSWAELVRAVDRFSVQRVPATGDAYSLSRYPYAALVSPSTHTDVKVMNYEEILGTENQ